MTTKQDKVYRASSRQKATRNHPARIVAERKASNFELMRDTIAARGHVRIRTAFQIECANGDYAGARGTSLRFLAETVDQAEAFFREVAEVLPEMARNRGLVMLTPKPKKKEAAHV
jgi:hypothetical protein